MASTESPLHVSNEDLAILSQNMSAIATDFLFWGLYSSLVFVAIYLLVAHGLRNSRARQFQLFIVLLMFVVTSTKAICDMLYYQGQLVLISEAFANGQVDMQKLVDHWVSLNIAGSILQRVNFVLSDGIVVWRAWVLWPEQRIIRIILAICMIGTFLGMVVEVTFGVLSFDHDFGSFLFGYFLVVPMLFTNVVATTTVGIKAWCYRKDARKLYANQSKTSVVERILIILTESGVIYCLIWITYIVNRRYRGADTPLRYVIIDYTIPVLSAIYPTLIIIIVSMDKSSQTGAVYSNRPPAPVHRVCQTNEVEFSAFQAAPGRADSESYQSRSDKNGEKVQVEIETV